MEGGVLFVGPPKVRFVGHDVVCTFDSEGRLVRLRSSRADYRRGLEMGLRELDRVEDAERSAENVIKLKARG